MADYTQPRWTSTALIVVDLQRDFLDDGVAPIPGSSAVVAPVTALTDGFRRAGRPIVHVVRLYRPGSSDVDPPRRQSIEQGAEVVAPGTEGAQIADGVLPPGVRLDAERLLAGQAQTVGPDEMIIAKPRWSAFYRTSLAELLRQRACDTVVVAGCNLPNCPRATLFDASARDFRTVLVRDAVSQTSPERLTDLERIGVTVHRTADVLAALGVG